MALENFPVHSCLKLPPNGHAGAAGDHRPQLPLASGVVFQDRSSVSGTSLVRPEPGFGVVNTITSGPVSLGGKRFLPESWQETGGWGSSRACGWEAPPSSDPRSSSGWGTHAAHMTSPSRHGPGTAPAPPGRPCTPSGPDCCWHSRGLPGARRQPLRTGSRKARARKRPERRGPSRQDPDAPAGVTGGGQGRLPERAAGSSPAVRKKNHVSGAIAACCARPPAGSAVLGPGRGHGHWVPLTSIPPLAAPVRTFLPARESTLARMRPNSACERLSRLCTLYLWFWSPGSQAGIAGAGRESPAASAVSPPSLAEPQESQRHTHTHPLRKKEVGGSCLISGDPIHSRCSINTR